MAASTRSVRCLVIDGHPVVRDGIRALLEREVRDVEAMEAPTLEAALEGPAGGGAESRRADVVVIDPPRSPEIGETLSALARRFGAAIVVFTTEGGARLLAEALQAGVKGYVRKDSPSEDLVRAVRAALTGDFYVDPALSSTIVLDEGERTLTPRQREILQMLADGRQTDTVSQELGLSTETVRTHTKRILAKLGAGTRTQAVAIGLRNGLIE